MMILERSVYIANVGAMTPAQRRAMWAKRSNPAGAPRTTAPHAPVTSLPVRGRPVNVGILPGEWDPIGGGPAADGRPAAPVKPVPGWPIPIKPIDQIRQPPTGVRGWGELRPGEMYPAVEGPGNPSWERRHPERAPGGLPAERPRGYTPPIIPRDPRGQPGVMYPGGTPNFDERTGRYVTPQDLRAVPLLRYPGGTPNFDERTGRYTTPSSRIQIDDGGIALPRGQGRELDPNVRQAIAGLQNMLDRLRGFST